MSEEHITILIALKFAHQQLAKTNPSQNNKIAIQEILCYLLKKNTTFLYTWPEYKINNAIWLEYQDLIVQFQQGKPLAYILGTQEFWQHTFKVNENVLIPRSESEIIVTEALKRMSKNKEQKILELGTGSGAIIISIAAAQNNNKFTAIDICPMALKIAQENARNILCTADIIQFKHSDWFSNIHESFDIIISNPPYIDYNDKHLCPLVREYEPKLALIAENNGLAALETIINNSHKYLNKNGYLILEHGFQQRQSLNNYIQNNFHKIWYVVQLIDDLENKPRTIVLQKK